MSKTKEICASCKKRTKTVGAMGYFFSPDSAPVMYILCGDCAAKKQAGDNTVTDRVDDYFASLTLRRAEA